MKTIEQIVEKLKYDIVKAKEHQRTSLFDNEFYRAEGSETALVEVLDFIEQD